MKKTTIISAVALSLSLNVSANIGLHAKDKGFQFGAQDFKFGNLKSNFVNGQKSLRGIGASNSGSFSNFNYSLWVADGNSGLDFNRRFQSRSGASALFGISAMDGLKSTAAYADFSFGKFKLGISSLSIATAKINTNTISKEPRVEDPAQARPKPEQLTSRVRPNDENCKTGSMGICLDDTQKPRTSLLTQVNAVEKQDTGKDAFVWIGDAAKDADKWVSGAGNDMGQPARDAILWVKGAANSTADWTKGAGSDTMNWIGRSNIDMTKWVATVFNDSTGWVGGAAKDADNWVSGVATDMGKPVRDAAAWIVQAAKDTDKTLFIDSGVDTDVKRAAKDTEKWVDGATNNTRDWVGHAAQDGADWVDGAAKDVGDFFGGIFGATGQVNYPVNQTMSMQKLRSGTNVELSYMVSNKTMLTVNATGALNSRHMLSDDSYLVVEGKNKEYIGLSYGFRF